MEKEDVNNIQDEFRRQDYILIEKNEPSWLPHYNKLQIHVVISI